MAFKYAAYSAWNQLQDYLYFWKLVSLGAFEVILNDLNAVTSCCRFFECVLMSHNSVMCLFYVCNYK